MSDYSLILPFISSKVNKTYRIILIFLLYNVISLLNNTFTNQNLAYICSFFLILEKRHTASTNIIAAITIKTNRQNIALRSVFVL